MNRPWANLIVDLCAGMLFLAMISTGYLLQFALPPGTNKDFLLWGISRHDWGAIHAWISLGFLLTIAVHLVLHWQWCVSTIESKLTWLQIPGLSAEGSALVIAAALAVLVSLFAWTAQQGISVVAESSSERCVPEDQAAGLAKSAPHPANPRSAGAIELPAKISTSEIPTTPIAAAPQLAERARDYLSANCVECHGASRPAAGIRLDRIDDLVAPQEGTFPWVNPGKSGQSLLPILLSGERATRKQPRVHVVPEGDVELFRQWIDAGAPWPKP